MSIVNSVKEIDITRASDFLVLEKQQLEFTIAKLEKVYKEHASISSQLEQVLQLKHDIAFFLNQRSITKQIGDLDDIPRVEEPHEIGKFNKEDFAKAVVKKIQSQYNIGDEDVGTDILKCTTQNKETYDGETHDSYVGRRFCAAIDIGSTYSGYAFSSKDEYEKEPTKVHTSEWLGSKLLSYKAPTAVLFDNSQEFLAFGYEAENIYSELVLEGEDADYYYFKQFKMLLYDKRITMDMKIKDERGREMEALTVFQHCIKYLKDHLFKAITDKFNGVRDYNLHYVLTVPAMWCNSANQFMEAAALKAGIRYDQLSISLEPDAAVMYCQHLKTERQGPTNIIVATEGMKYMVIDLGGGTAEITCHQISRDGTLKEFVPPSGGPWGGSSIDEAFCSFLKRICGPKVIEELYTVELEDYIGLFREFETKKRSIRVDQTNKVVITLPVALLDLVKKHKGKMKTALEQSPYGPYASYSKQNLNIQPDTFRNLFKATGDSLVKHLDRMFKDEKLSDLDTVLMVGGFAECEYIQHRIKERFGNDKKIIIPEEAGLAVLKGAVLLGHQGIHSRRVLRSSHIRHTVLA